MKEPIHKKYELLKIVKSDTTIIKTRHHYYELGKLCNDD